MKKLLPLLLLALLPVLLTGCDDDDYYYGGYDYDQYLPGRWELISANGRPVSGYQVNYLEFYTNGSGTYFYYDNRRPYEMDLRWGVQFWNNSQVLYITYADGSQVSMDYWYNSNATRLYTGWYEGGYYNEYVYRLVDDFTWPAPSLTRSADADADTDLPYPLRPGKPLTEK